LQTVKPARFEYFCPTTAAEAIDLLASHDGNARFLAGGQSLVPLLNFRVVTPSALIDLGRCAELDELRRDGDTLIFGPMVRQSTAETSELVRSCCPLISITMPFIGSRTIRNRGTIGGTLAHADRIAELPAVALVLGATMIAEGPNRRRAIAAEDFYIGDLTTDLAPDEMLREIRFPVSSAGHRFAFVEATNRHHDLTLAGVAVNLYTNAGRCERASIAVIGIGPRPLRLAAAERILARDGIDKGAVRAAAASSLEGIEFETDLHATSDYRRHVLPGLVERALDQALSRTPEAAQ
jgi:CO/xanthine dehydrogenase FAD-binding subunit